ncbi:hypothetical protein Agabi119p4_10407 [Agaricus bisporus var. burnettii]|uniref:Fungal calcium binding protein domain-containing protein n=1 Tax=Agaricus bisporus var. burnettii TaxID=192524 RepID=A0A8H7C2V2_AGABI|nr:hypothetical protein Agabi119p4_10407 [Agaricus bisporus var. burnettii]
MKFTLAIIPAFFALSAFGSPVEQNTRQRSPALCNHNRCIPIVAARFSEISSCAATLENLTNIQQAEGQGKPPSQTDQKNYFSNGFKCLSDTDGEGFSIPVDCNNCIHALPGTPS